MTERNRIGIVVGGGPAPGINSVISAACIRGVLAGSEVIGIRDGFERLMQGDVSHVMPLDIPAVSRLHFRGGSLLGTSRANPTKNPTDLATTVESLKRLGISHLITIGGDDTAYTAYRVEQQSGGSLHVVHVPKTIDNDLDLPQSVDTFGYQSARHVGFQIVHNLMVDAHTTSRWYLVIAMGRKAGHLALGIGKAVGATLTLIPEEFQVAPIPLKKIVDTLAMAVIKRQSEGRRDGVAVIAEGVALSIDPAELAEVGQAERDPHGNIRIAEIAIGELLRKAVAKRLGELGVKATLVSKDLGYELRCADPIPADIEYTRDLGYCATKYLLEGGSAAMVSMQGGQFVPVPFTDLLDPETGKTKVRLADISSTRYAIARRYMIRLRRDDFANPEALERMAKVAGMSVEQFREEFGSLIEDELPPIVLRKPDAA